MTEQQEQLTKIVSRRKVFTNKNWESTNCDFEHKTYIEVFFRNTESDFRGTKYPTVEEAIKDQTMKLERDVRASFDSGKDLKPLLSFLLA